jgi:hypothetical protein
LGAWSAMRVLKSVPCPLAWLLALLSLLDWSVPADSVVCVGSDVITF